MIPSEDTLIGSCVDDKKEMQKQKAPYKCHVQHLNTSSTSHVTYWVYHSTISTDKNSPKVSSLNCFILFKYTPVCVIYFLYTVHKEGLNNSHAILCFTTHSPQSLAVPINVLFHSLHVHVHVYYYIYKQKNLWHE